MFSSCNHTCGGLGMKCRTRLCTNPVPTNGGRKCRGLNETCQHCNFDICPGIESHFFISNKNSEFTIKVSLNNTQQGDATKVMLYCVRW